MRHLPQIEKHPLLQKLMWEIDVANRVSDFVKTCKTASRSLAGKYVQMERGRAPDNYMQFKNNIKYERLEKMIDMANRCKVDIQQERQDLNNWNGQYLRYE